MSHVTQSLFCFPANGCVENFRIVFAKKKCPSGPVPILVDALSGVDHVLVPAEPDSGVMVTWPSLNVPDNHSLLPSPNRSRGKVDDYNADCGVATL